MEGAAESQRGKSIKDNNEPQNKTKQKSLGRSEGVGNKGGGSDRSRDVTMCESIKCPRSGIFNNSSYIMN